jgi:hypothetical protein
MWFTKKKISNEQIEARLFEFKGAVQTCDLNVIRYSLNVLTVDLPSLTKDSQYFKEIIEFDGSLSKDGRARRILYNAFENLLRSIRLNSKIELNDITNKPHGFSCPENNNFENLNFIDNWTNSNTLNLNLDEFNISNRIKIFEDFLFDENYNDDELNEIKWHNSDLTSDLVSGAKFAYNSDGSKQNLKPWEEFSDSISSTFMGKLDLEKKKFVLDKFSLMLRHLPYNNFKK